MTVTYTSEVTTSRGLFTFLKLLKRWKGSIYKLVWAELLVFLLIYFALNFMYRFILDEHQKKIFEGVVHYCDRYSNLIPVSFVLGFYVSIIMTRWWEQYTSIPYPDNLAILIGAIVKGGQEERSRIIRRTIVRYVCLTFTMTLTMVSPKVKKRFPTFDHLIDAGLMNGDEKIIMENLNEEFPTYSKYWLPLAWASNIVTRARYEGLIRDDTSVRTILEELNRFRSQCGSILDYDWISVPLVYTQVVTLAVYTYFMTRVIGRQSGANVDDEIDTYFPFFLVLEFFFYMGWLKVAESLINPFGEDDDDFEVVWMIDRHVQVTYLLVDKIHEQHPKLLRDKHWYEIAPNSLPFTLASKNYMEEYPFPSTLNINVNKSEQTLVVSEPKDTSEVDGKFSRSGAFLWRMFGKKYRSKKKSVDYLREISISGVGKSVNLPEDIKYNNNKNQTSIGNDNAYFEALRLQRKEEQHKKLLYYIELIKQSKK